MNKSGLILCYFSKQYRNAGALSTKCTAVLCRAFLFELIIIINPYKGSVFVKLQKPPLDIPLAPGQGNYKNLPVGRFLICFSLRLLYLLSGLNLRLFSLHLRYSLHSSQASSFLLFPLLEHELSCLPLKDLVYLNLSQCLLL